jgi:type I restriction enzyme S subunit
MREDWVATTVHELVSNTGLFSNGDWIESKDQTPDGEVRLIQLADIGDGKFKNKSAHFLSLKRAKKLKCTFLKQGDILIARTSSPLGRATIFPLEGDNKFITVVDVIIIRPNSTVDPKFLLYIINSPQIRKEIADLQSGTTIQRISKKKFSTIIFPLAPLVEQYAIVAKIERFFSKLDNAIANLKRAQKKLDIYHQAVLKEAFAGMLTKTWREQQTDLPTADELLAQIKQARKEHSNQQLENWEKTLAAWEADGKKTRKPVRPKNMALVTELIEEEKASILIAKNWIVTKLGYISKNIIDGNHRTPAKTENGIPFITISNIKNNKVNFNKTFYVSDDYFSGLPKYKKPIYGDVLYTVTGSFGIPVRVNYHKNFCFQRHIGLIRPLSIMDSKWLFWLLKTHLIYNQAVKAATGVAQKTVGITSLRNFVIPLCSPQEQAKIVKEVESRLFICDKFAIIMQKNLRKAQSLRQSILNKAFEGGL